MNVELITTGTELLLGNVLNTHVAAIATAIFPLGLRISRQVTVPDGPAIREALLESFGRADIVIVTGGLGPTTDDITREITAELLGLELVHDEEVMQSITERFVRRCLTVGERVKRQAQRPREATMLHNDHGTAPGLYFPPQRVSIGSAEAHSPHIFLLPGPPRELRPMVDKSMIPILRGLTTPPDFALRTWKFAGIGESQVEDKVGEALVALGAELGYCARPGEVDVRVIGTPAQLEAAAEILHGQLAEHLVAEDGRSLESVVVELLTARKATLATAESCTGGYLAHRVTNIPGASAVFTSGFVTYANEAKVRDLGVDAEIIQQHGAVSRQTAIAMATGALARANADFALTTTGIAGPSGGSKEKPVGTVYIGLAERGRETEGHHFRFQTDRETFKDMTTQAALNLLRLALLRVEPASPR